MEDETNAAPALYLIQEIKALETAMITCMHRSMETGSTDLATGTVKELAEMIERSRQKLTGE